MQAYDAATLATLDHAARIALADRVPMGAHPGGGAQHAISAAASAFIRDHGGMPKNTRGKYGLRDKYADAPRFSLSPYRTPQMYASGKAGRRAVPPAR